MAQTVLGKHLSLRRFIFAQQVDLSKAQTKIFAYKTTKMLLRLNLRRLAITKYAFQKNLKDLYLLKLMKAKLPLLSFLGPFPQHFLITRLSQCLPTLQNTEGKFSIDV